MFYLPESCQQNGVGAYFSKVWSPCGRMHLGWGFYNIWTWNVRVWHTGHAQWLLPVVWACSVRVMWVRWLGTPGIWCNMVGNKKNCIPRSILSLHINMCEHWLIINFPHKCSICYSLLFDSFIIKVGYPKSNICSSSWSLDNMFRWGCN